MLPSRGPARVFGGDMADPCEWPTVVAMGGDVFCTGTLIHPEIVVYAAHCGTHPRVLFGEDATDPALAIETITCETNPLFDGEVGASDFAYCRLAQAVDLAVVPPLRGCERDAIQVGREALLVGFGETGEQGPGHKHFASTRIEALPVERVVLLGSDAAGTCPGDSGAPAFIQLDDGSSRVFALTSGGQDECGANISAHVLLDHVVDWIEDDSGLDLTPCHSEDGSWVPTPACGGFPVDAGAGAWSAGCADGSLSGPSRSCGAPFGAPPDASAPVVAIVAPDEDVDDPSPPLELTVHVEAEDPGGWGVRSVWLTLDGLPALDEAGLPLADETAPYDFYEVRVASGSWVLAAHARDWAGNERQSKSVLLTVGDPAEGDEEGEPEVTGACACSPSARPCPLLGLPVLVLARRRPTRPAPGWHGSDRSP